MLGSVCSFRVTLEEKKHLLALHIIKESESVEKGKKLDLGSLSDCFFSMGFEKKYIHIQYTNSKDTIDRNFMIHPLNYIFKRSEIKLNR